ncbi:MAG: hypothetical protein Q9160_006768 [Pyrenula sp. 1 TL-2023]
MDDRYHTPATPTSFLSPASPVTASYSSASPSYHSHFHSFHRKFRRPSASQTPDSPSDPNIKSSGPATESVRPTRTNEAAREAVREVKRFLQDNIRDDWSYEPSSTHRTSEDGEKNSELPEDFPKPIDYTRRQSSSSDAPTDDEGYHDARDPMWVDGDSHDTHTFKFESPEDVGNAIKARKKLKQRRAKEEMAWNNGLSIWTDRRNQWTRATRHRPGTTDISTVAHDQQLNGNDPELERGNEEPESGPVRPLSPPDSRLYLEDSDDDEDDDEEPYLPIQPPLIPPSNPIRAAIGPSMYPTIYSKVVVQGLAPSVPVPLTHIVKSLILGWKEEGNWPPRPSAAPPPAPSDSARLTARGGSSVVAQAKKEMTRLARLGRDREREHSKRGSVGGMGEAMRKAFGFRGHKFDDDSFSRGGGSTTGYGERDEEIDAEGDILVADDDKW